MHRKASRYPCRTNKVRLDWDKSVKLDVLGSAMSDEMKNGVTKEEEDALSSSSESNGGFSTGTSEDDVASSTSSQSDDAVRKPPADRADQATPMPSTHTDHSVVRGEFIVDDDDDENDVPPDPLLYSFEEMGPRSHSGTQSVDRDHDPVSIAVRPNDLETNVPMDLSYITPPRSGQSALEPNAIHESEMDEEEHEIVFEPSEPADLQALFESSVDDPNSVSDTRHMGDVEGTSKDADGKNSQRLAAKEQHDSRGHIFRIFPRRRQRDEGGTPLETDTLAIPNGSSDVEQSNRRRQGWFPFTRQRQSTRLDNLNETLSAPAQLLTSPARTEPISDASETPNRDVQSPLSFFGKRTKPASKETNDPSETVPLSGLFPKREMQPQDPSERQDDAANEDDDTSTLGIAVSVQTLISAGIALTLLVVLSTIGTSFLGAELALRGNTVVLDRIVSPEPNGTLNVALPGENSTQSPTAAPTTSFCTRGQFLLEFEIQFDSQPVEVGFSLQDSGTFGGASLWAFDAFSFRSFSQFMRKNVFSICLAREPTYNFEITDALANGLVSQFGTSTLVYGQWSLVYNSIVLATYNGNCNTTTRQRAKREKYGTISSCGVYCACSFRFSSENTTGRCSTNCTSRGNE